MHPSRLGEASELTVAKYYTEQGCQVFLPFGHDTEIDLIAVDGPLDRRVQVKTVYERRGLLRANVHKDGKPKYIPRLLDVIACVYGDRLWLIPPYLTKGALTLTFGKIDGSSYKSKTALDCREYEVSK